MDYPKYHAQCILLNGFSEKFEHSCTLPHTTLSHGERIHWRRMHVTKSREILFLITSAREHNLTEVVRATKYSQAVGQAPDNRIEALFWKPVTLGAHQRNYRL